MSPGQPREALAGVIEETRDRAERLLELLVAERAALRAGDAGEIESIAGRKLVLVDALETLAERQRCLLGEAGLATPGDLAGHPALADLAAEWARVQDRLRRCRDANRVNGGIVDLSQRFTRQVLGYLNGVPQGATLYGPSGQTRSVAVKGSVATA